MRRHLPEQEWFYDAEALTDRLVTPAYAALPQAERAAFVATLAAIQVALTS